VNDYDTKGLEALFAAAGWTVQRSSMVDGLQRLWRLAAQAV
jgi:hypothetical protein